MGLYAPSMTAPTRRDTGGPASADRSARVVRGALQRTGGFVAVNVITAAGAILVLRHLGVASFGRYGTVMALLAIVQGLSEAGLSLTGSRELALAPDSTARSTLLDHLLALRIVLAGIAAATAVGFAGAVGYPTVMVEGAALVGGAVFLQSVQATLLLPLVVDLENSRLTLNDVGGQIVLVGCFLGLTVAGAPLVAFFGAQLLAALLSLLWTPFLLRGHWTTAWPQWSRRELWRLLTRTSPLAVIGVLTILYFRIAVVIMSLLEPHASATGYFVTSAKVMEMFTGLPAVLMGVIFPVLAVSGQQDAAELQRLTMRLTSAMAVLGAACAITVGAGAHVILLGVGGQQYLPAAPLLRIQSIALFTTFVSTAWSTTLAALGRPRGLLVSISIGLATVLILCVGLIPILGSTGAAAATTTADVLLAFGLFASAARVGAVGRLTANCVMKAGVCAAPPLIVAVLLHGAPLLSPLIALSLYLILVATVRAAPPELVALAAAPAARIRSLLSAD